MLYAMLEIMGGLAERVSHLRENEDGNLAEHVMLIVLGVGVVLAISAILGPTLVRSSPVPWPSWVEINVCRGSALADIAIRVD